MSASRHNYLQFHLLLYEIHPLTYLLSTHHPAQGAKGISLFLVDAGTKGFSKGTKLKKLGMKAQDTCELFFEDCRIPKSALLGEVNKVSKQICWCNCLCCNPCLARAPA